MRFHADLHIHSKYSRATSRDLDLEHLTAWACRKGVSVVGTGDFTHPAWRAELKDKLVPAEPGLFRLRDDLARAVAAELPPACRLDVRFMLQVEISTIYKKGDRTRKVHHLIYAPDFATADRFSDALGKIGNITSDGRPILGLDSRHLLEITLASGPDAYLIPAHIWTPWFAVLGSMSGFDNIADCYGDLTDHIFAVETGLSSDPPMNWRLSMLDRYRLVSNSDAHSPGKLGREATTFDTDRDYYAIRRALETGEGFAGTVEFFPEEGKYHHDGHRNCGVRLTPAETLAHNALCPRCEQPLTVGVLHRAEKLADRPAGCAPPAGAGAVSNLVPLPEVLSEIVSSGPASKTVQRSYDRLITSLGPELAILDTVPTEDIARAESTLLAEAIARLRAGRVIREPGYDGEYGVIRLFDEGELKRITAGGRALFDTDVPRTATKKTPGASRAKVRSGGGADGASASNAADASADGPKAAASNGAAAAAETPGPTAPTPVAPAQPTLAEVDEAESAVSSPRTPRQPAHTLLAGLDADQRRAAETTDGPLLIVAGPGSGKTRTITHRIAHLVAERGVPAGSCLAITFTRRAAGEMRERLGHLLASFDAANASDAVDTARDGVAIHTFHSLGLEMLREQAEAAGLASDFRIASEPDRIDALRAALDLSERKAQSLLRAISKAKRTAQAPEAGDSDPAFAEQRAAYDRTLAARHWLDFDDLVGLPVRLLDARPDLAAHYRERFRWISVDEFQDVDEAQYRLITQLTPANGNLCVIGDPNQAIYGFRGADASCFERFARDFPTAVTVALSRNYRSTGTIVSASAQVITTDAASAGSRQTLAGIVRGMQERITIQAAPSDRAEAEFVTQTIERLMGGHSLHAIDQRRGSPGAGAHAAPLGFADFAVLFRTDAQSAALVEAFTRSGIPFRKHAHEPLTERPGVRALLDELARVASAGAPEPNIETTATLQAQLRRAADQLEDSCFTGTVAEEATRDTAQDAARAVANRDSALQRLLTLADACGGDRARFADAVAVASEADFWDPRADRVSLLTLHASKGLEFPIVFITGLEDGLLPFHWDTPDPAAAAEERRLFYVGMTRARERLFLSRAAQRLWRGRVRAQDPSPFLDDIEAELVKHQQTAAPRRKPEQRQLDLL